MNAGTIVFVVLCCAVVWAGAAMGWRDWKRGPRMLGGFPVPPGCEGAAMASMEAREKEAAAARLLEQIERVTDEVAKIGVTAADAQRGFDEMRKLLERKTGDEPGPCSIPRDEHPEDFADRMARACKRRHEERMASHGEG